MTGDGPFADTCDCYECVGSKTAYTEDGHRYVVNNLKKHTLLEPCEQCGKPKSEYRDLGRKGYYECWWCGDRAASDPHGPPETQQMPDETAPAQTVFVPSGTWLVYDDVAHRMPSIDELTLVADTTDG